MASDPHDAKEHKFDEIRRAAAPAPTQRLDLRELGEVKLPVTAELGRRKMLVREVLQLKRGAVVQLDKQAGEMSDIYVSGLVFARGEVIPLGDALHVRIGEVIGASEKDDKTGGESHGE